MRAYLSGVWNSPDDLATIFRYLTFAGVILAAAVSSLLYFVNDRIGKLQSSQIDAQGAQVNQQSETIAKQSNLLDEQASKIGGLNNLVSELKKSEKELRDKSLLAEKNITKYYDYNGVQRSQIGGRIVMDMKEQFDAFQIINKIERRKTMD